jgi:glycosyltransferase involved in cell wall biosynthesis
VVQGSLAVTTPFESSSPTLVLASTQRGWHGGEAQAELLAVGLRQRGWRCVMLARRDGALAERMAAADFEVVTFSGGGRGPGGLWKMRQALRRVRPDVLYYNDSHAITGAGIASLGLRYGDRPKFRGDCPNFRPSENGTVAFTSPSRSGENGTVPLRPPRPLRIAARRVDFAVRSPRSYRWFCDRVICVSNAVAEVCRAGGLTGEMLRVVHDGVEPGRVRSGDRQRGRQSLGLGEDRPLLLTVATLTDHKGHRFLLDAMPAVLREMPNVTLALAGDGELLDPLRQQAQRLGVLPHVRFLGYRSDVPDLMQAADVFVLPSHMEGLCTALIDAMLAPRTIVTTTAGGIPDLLGDQIGREPLAWTVPPRDPPALARSILSALASPDASAAMRERARRRAEEHFTADCMVEATLSVFREGLAALQQRTDQ